MKNKESPVYDSWKAMRQRCYNVNNKGYKNYGGRGITVCDAWDDFLVFHKWCMANGYDKSLTLDRIDNGGNYDPSNCRYATRQEQVENQRLRSDNRTGYVGIHYADKRPYTAYIQFENRYKFLGNFATLKEAVDVRNSYIINNNLPHKIQEYKGTKEENSA